MNLSIIHYFFLLFFSDNGETDFLVGSSGMLEFSLILLRIQTGPGIRGNNVRVFFSFSSSKKTT